MNKSSGNIPALTKCLLVEAVNELSEVRVLIVLVMFCNSDELVMNRFSFIKFYTKNKIQFHHDGGEPANERDEEAACRGPESTHMRVLLDGALVERFAIEPFSDFSAK